MAVKMWVLILGFTMLFLNTHTTAQLTGQQGDDALISFIVNALEGDSSQIAPDPLLQKACPQDQVYCIQKAACVPKQSQCYYGTSSSSSSGGGCQRAGPEPDDPLVSLLVSAVGGKKECVDGNCGVNQVFCIEQGTCASASCMQSRSGGSSGSYYGSSSGYYGSSYGSGSYYSWGSSYSHSHSSQNQNNGGCAQLSQVSSDPLVSILAQTLGWCDPGACRPDQVYCFQQQKCVPADHCTLHSGSSGSSNYPSSSSYSYSSSSNYPWSSSSSSYSGSDGGYPGSYEKCQDNIVHTDDPLAQLMISVLGGKTNNCDQSNCRKDQVFCAEAGRCVSNHEGLSRCNEDRGGNLPYTTTTRPRTTSDYYQRTSELTTPRGHSTTTVPPLEVRAGTCPTTSTYRTSRCVHECFLSDSDCINGTKCCSVSNCWVCVAPDVQNTGSRAYILSTFSAGENVTFRLPTIVNGEVTMWMKSTPQGRLQYENFGTFVSPTTTTTVSANVVLKLSLTDQTFYGKIQWNATVVNSLGNSQQYVFAVLIKPQNARPILTKLPAFNSPVPAREDTPVVHNVSDMVQFTDRDNNRTYTNAVSAEDLKIFNDQRSREFIRQFMDAIRDRINTVQKQEVEVRYKVIPLTNDEKTGTLSYDGSFVVHNISISITGFGNVKQDDSESQNQIRQLSKRLASYLNSGGTLQQFQSELSTNRSVLSRRKRNAPDQSVQYYSYSVPFSTRGSFLTLDQKIAFNPTKDFNGLTSIILTPWDGLEYGNPVEIEYNVMPRNDAPRMKDTTISNILYGVNIPSPISVPYNISTYAGVLVQELMRSHFEDIDRSQQVIGMYIMRAQNTTLGTFQYKMPGGTWTDIMIPDDNSIRSLTQIARTLTSSQQEIAYSVLTGDLASSNMVQYVGAKYQRNLTVMLLKADAHIRYYPSSLSSVWDQLTARRMANFGFGAWDMSDNKTSGTLVQIKTPVCVSCGQESSLGVGYILSYAQKLGCDNRPSSGRVIDRCGKCGGNGRGCVDCNGDIFGTARYDTCGKCVGGGTNKVFNYAKDCRGECDGNFVHLSVPYATGVKSVCMRNGTNITVFLQETTCNGFINAQENECGFCVGGTSRRPKDYGKDACGLCGSDNSTCRDCSGVLHGSHEVDRCGDCKDTSDATFNQGCTKLSDFSKSLVPNFISTSLQVRGANLKSLYNWNHRYPACQWISSSRTVNITRLYFYSFSDIINVYHSPGDVPADTYGISCVFTTTNGPVTKTLMNKKVTFYGAATVTSLSQNNTDLGQSVQVTVSGSGFVNSTNLTCLSYILYRVKRKEINKNCQEHCMYKRYGCTTLFPATYINPNTVQCDLTCLKHSRLPSRVDIKVMADRPTYSTYYGSPSSVRFTIKSPPPVLIKAVFHRTYCRLNVHFNIAVEGPRVCSQLFDDATSHKLGHGAYCWLGYRKYIRIYLGRNSSLVPNDAIVLRGGNIKLRRAEDANYATGQVTVNGSDSTVSTKMYLTSLSTVGSCDSFYIYSRTWSGYMCRAQLSWNASYAGNASAAITSNLNALNARLQNETGSKRIRIDKTEITPGETFTISAFYTDLAGRRTTPATKDILRKDSIIPISARFSGDNSIDVKSASRPVFLYVSTNLSKCVNVSAAVRKFKWTATASDNDTTLLDDFLYKSTKYYLYIRPQWNTATRSFDKSLLRGGVNYTFTVDAYLNDDIDQTSSASKQAIVQSQPLEPHISGRKKFGSDEYVKLSGENSKDPDNSDYQTYYEWSCQKVKSDGSLRTCYTLDSNDTLVPLDSLLQEGVDLAVPQLLSVDQYVFTLLMTKGQRSASTTHNITVVASAPPVVVISPIFGEQDPNNIVRVKAIISSSVAFTVTWSSPYVDDADFASIEFDDYDVVGSEVESGRCTNKEFYFTIAPKDGGSSLPPGLSIQFAVEVTHDTVEANSATADIDIKMNAPPTGCEVTLPTTGQALAEITVRVERCSDKTEDLPLTYVYYKISRATNLRELLRDGEDTVSVYLAGGEYYIEVKVCDQLGTCADFRSENYIVISGQPDITNVIASISRIIDETLLLSLQENFISSDQSSSNVSDSDKQAVTEAAISYTVSTFTQINADVDDPKTTFVKIEVSIKILSNTKQQPSLSVNIAIVGTLQNMINRAAYGSSTGSIGTGSRRRRAVSSGNAGIGMTASEAKTILNSYSALYPDANSTVTADNSRAYITAIESTMISLCQPMAQNEAPVVVTSDLINVKTNKRAFATIGNETLDMDCNGCNSTAQMVLGFEMQDKFATWNCTSSEQCEGTCLASARFHRDMLTIGSTAANPLVSAIRSDVVALLLVHPKTYEFHAVTNLTDPIQVTLEVTGNLNDSLYRMECRHWLSGDWSTAACETGEIFEKNGTSHVTCSCTSNGYIGIFEATPIATTTVAPTTTAIETTTTSELYTTGTNEVTTAVQEDSTVADSITTTFTAVPSNVTTQPPSSITFQFKVQGNYSVLVAGNETYATEHFKRQISVSIQVALERFNTFVLSAGSILFEFEILHSDAVGQPTLQAISSNLRILVETNTLNLTEPGTNTILATIANSFSFNYTYAAPTTASVTNKPETNNKDLVPIVVGSVLGTAVLIVAVVIVIIIINKKNNQGRGKIQPTPLHSQTNVNISYQQNLSREDSSTTRASSVTTRAASRSIYSRSSGAQSVQSSRPVSVSHVRPGSDLWYEPKGGEVNSVPVETAESKSREGTSLEVIAETTPLHHPNAPSDYDETDQHLNTFSDVPLDPELHPGSPSDIEMITKTLPSSPVIPETEELETPISEVAEEMPATHRTTPVGTGTTLQHPNSPSEANELSEADAGERSESRSSGSMIAVSHV